VETLAVEVGAAVHPLDEEEAEDWEGKEGTAVGAEGGLVEEDSGEASAATSVCTWSQPSCKEP
jgi:16S rRNA U1498 N3-methylase RsmE